MINLYSNVMSLWPASIIMSPKLSLLTPSIAQVWDYERVSPTSAVGSSIKSLQGTIGEYLERKHFFNEIIPLPPKKLGDMMSETAANAFISAFKQTSEKNTEVITNHPFKTVKAYNMLTLEETEIPAISVALDNISVRDDFEFYPFRDTCGCSCHVSLLKAINGSLGELMERQSLLVYWLKGFAKDEVRLNIPVGIDYLDELVRNLKREGELMVLDITLPGAPGYVILSLYGTNKKGNSIKYGAGLSYSEDKMKAVGKSLAELWQSYICMHNFIIGGYKMEELIDRYQTHFMSCNKYDVFENLKENTTFLPSGNIGEYAQGSLLEYLGNLTSNVFLYKSREKTSEGIIWYTKVLSPDLFMHMDNSSPININNKLYIRGAGFHERECAMVPFP